jgi:hypothetical protein
MFLQDQVYPRTLRAVGTITELASHASSRIRLTTFLPVQSRSFVVQRNRLNKSHCLFQPCRLNLRVFLCRSLFRLDIIRLLSFRFDCPQSNTLVISCPLLLIKVAANCHCARFDNVNNSWVDSNASGFHGVWRLLSSGMLCHVVLWVITDVSEESLLHIQNRILGLSVYLEDVWNGM